MGWWGFNPKRTSVARMSEVKLQLSSSQSRVQNSVVAALVQCRSTALPSFFVTSVTKDQLANADSLVVIWLILTFRWQFNIFVHQLHMHFFFLHTLTLYDGKQKDSESPHNRHSSSFRCRVGSPVTRQCVCVSQGHSWCNLFLRQSLVLRASHFYKVGHLVLEHRSKVKE